MHPRKQSLARGKKHQDHTEQWHSSNSIPAPLYMIPKEMLLPPVNRYRIVPIFFVPVSHLEECSLCAGSEYLPGPSSSPPALGHPAPSPPSTPCLLHPLPLLACWCLQDNRCCWKLQVATWTSCECSKSVKGAVICVAIRAVMLHLCW